VQTPPREKMTDPGRRLFTHLVGPVFIPNGNAGFLSGRGVLVTTI
jgi:hypothetical protein